jgi:hypothetical protein
MTLPGFPGTVQGWHKLVEREQWLWREVRAKGGKKGLKRLYQPPQEVHALIRQRLLQRSFEQFRATVAVGEPHTTAMMMFLENYNSHLGTCDYVDGIEQITQESLEAALRLQGQGGGVAGSMTAQAGSVSFSPRPVASNYMEVMERNAHLVSRCSFAAAAALGPDHGRDQAVTLGIDTWGALCRMFQPDKADHLASISDADLELLARFVLNTKAIVTPVPGAK